MLHQTQPVPGVSLGLETRTFLALFDWLDGLFPVQLLLAADPYDLHLNHIHEWLILDLHSCLLRVSGANPPN